MFNEFFKVTQLLIKESQTIAVGWSQRYCLENGTKEHELSLPFSLGTTNDKFCQQWNILGRFP